MAVGGGGGAGAGDMFEKAPIDKGISDLSIDQELFKNETGKVLADCLEINS